MKKITIVIIGIILIGLLSLGIYQLSVMNVTLFEHQSTGDNAYGGVYNPNILGQTFTVGATGPNVNFTITSIRLKLYRFPLSSAGATPGTVYVKIYATDINGKPTGNVLASGSTDGNTLREGMDDREGGAWRDISVSEYTLLANTKYAFMVEVPTGNPWQGYVRCRMVHSDPVYIGGKLVDTSPYSGGCLVSSSYEGVTLNIDYDFMFEVYGISQQTSPEPPSEQPPSEPSEPPSKPPTVSEGNETSEQPSTPSTPGFELITLIIAIGIAFYILRRRQKI